MGNADSKNNGGQPTAGNPAATWQTTQRFYDFLREQGEKDRAYHAAQMKDGRSMYQRLTGAALA